ncbi:hypothetical protein ACFLWA_07130, partial [Chloroflexota bacterium]
PVHIDRTKCTLLATEIGCSAPSGVLEQQQRYLGTLGNVSSYRIQYNQLWLETDDGRALVFGVETDG